MTHLTGMRRSAPTVSHGTIFIPGVYSTGEKVEERGREHAERPTRHLTGDVAGAHPSPEVP